MGRQLLHNILIITFIHFRFIFTWTHWKRLLFNNLLSPNSVKVFFSRLIVSNFLQRENANLLSRSSCMHFINLSARLYFTNFFLLLGYTPANITRCIPKAWHHVCTQMLLTYDWLTPTGSDLYKPVVGVIEKYIEWNRSFALSSLLNAKF